MGSDAPIGVFDSGVGGLTIYRALRAALPHDDFIYFGDTAHLPYGAKSEEAIEGYTISAAQFLRGRQVKFLVIACNTVSALVLMRNGVQRELIDLPYCGVIAAGAGEAVKASKNGRIAVLATEATVRSRLYADVIHGMRGDADVQMVACGMLVALAEEGWCSGVEAEAVVARYLSMLKPGYDTLVLGCTHFPMLEPVFRKLCPPEVTIIDSAAVTAQAVVGFLSEQGLLNAQAKAGSEMFYVTDAPERFARVGAGFFGRGISDSVFLTKFS